MADDDSVGVNVEIGDAYRKTIDENRRLECLRVAANSNHARDIVVEARRLENFVLGRYGTDIDLKSNLVCHAKYELELLGEERETVQGYLEIITLFSRMGHSGGSASVFIPTLMALLNFTNLLPLTNNPREWQEVGEGTWQCIRNGEAFSDDGGMHYYLLSEGRDKENKPNFIHTSDPYFEPDPGPTGSYDD